ncbi:MAG: helix-turn-helix domain-containing protein, partial [Acidimicrobiia bacterium]
MESKLRAVFSGDLVTSVSVLCRELGISRQTFYKYRRRFVTEGPPGLVERSRRPNSHPAQLSTATEEEIVRLRKLLKVDNGAQAIFYQLRRGLRPSAGVNEGAWVPCSVMLRGGCDFFGVHLLVGGGVEKLAA